jgi:hypothetical protein
MLYPYTTPIFLTDTVFINYGGKTGTSTAFARNASYFIAEKEMSSHLHTLLQPTIVTGTYFWNTGNPFQMDWGYVHSILGVSVFSTLAEIYTFTASDLTHNVFIRNSKYGQVDIGFGCCSPCGSYPYPYTVTVAYNAGLPTGTSIQADMLWCLTMAAQLVLNEMSVDGFLANETPGAIGVQEFSNELYSEKRTKLGRSIFGSSPISQNIVNIVENLRASRVGRFRR